MPRRLLSCVPAASERIGCSSADFESGARKSSVAAMLPQAIMVRNEKNATDAEVEAAARWFAALPVRSRVTVVETASDQWLDPQGFAGAIRESYQLWDGPR